VDRVANWRGLSPSTSVFPCQHYFTKATPYYQQLTASLHITVKNITHTHFCTLQCLFYLEIVYNGNILSLLQFGFKQILLCMRVCVCLCVSHDRQLSQHSDYAAGWARRNCVSILGKGKKFFFSPKRQNWTLGLFTPLKGVPRTSSPVVKQSVRKADHLVPT
jgi:hypothetical protein